MWYSGLGWIPGGDVSLPTLNQRIERAARELFVLVWCLGMDVFHAAFSEESNCLQWIQLISPNDPNPKSTWKVRKISFIYTIIPSIKEQKDTDNRQKASRGHTWGPFRGILRKPWCFSRSSIASFAWRWPRDPSQEYPRSLAWMATEYLPGPLTSRGP